MIVPWEIVLFAVVMLFSLLSSLGALPTLFFALNPGAMRYGFDDPDAEQEMLSRSEALPEWIGRLRGMGFSLLGVKSEKLPLWGRAFREAAMVSRLTETYASIVLHPDGNPASLYFYTPLKSGGMVFTRNFAHGREAEDEGCSVKNVSSDDFRAILDSHENRLQKFRERGEAPLVGSSREARIQATDAFYRTEYWRRSGTYRISLVNVLSPLVIFLAGLMYFFIRFRALR